jgi:hypothetical protein
MPPSARSFWVVSQNVNGVEALVADWTRVIRSAKAAVMGWPHEKADTGRNLGHRFATEIKQNDVVLIARGTKDHRQLVACGMVTSDSATTPGNRKLIRNEAGLQIPTPRTFGSFRLLRPFKSLTEEESGQISFKGVSSSRHAMYKLDQEKLPDKRICRWLAKQLHVNLVQPHGRALPTKGRRRAKPVQADVSDEPRSVTSPEQSRNAQRLEAKLVKRYLAWVAEDGRPIEGALRYPVNFEEKDSTGQPCCDLFDPQRNLLIEAKSTTDRHRIRMAIGQLADYAHLHRKCGLKSPRTAILLPAKPSEDLEDLLCSLNIAIIWQKGRGFDDITECSGTREKLLGRTR